MIKNLTTLTWLLLLCGCLFSCTTKESIPKDLNKNTLIPKPTSLTATGKSFELTEKHSIFVAEENAELNRLGQYLADLLQPATGFNLTVKKTPKSVNNGIHLRLSSEENTLGPEGYRLTITENFVEIIGQQPAGLFYGIQTLRQLLPAAIEKNSPQTDQWLIATGTINDIPTYGHRGSMLDVSRHFFGPTDVKRYIDLISLYKMNVLHLHLADDQGWRIEIKSWPKLTEIGGSTQVGGGKGGFYTQEEYADIVKYAQDRFITIIPEIDMPGHTNAALASYPELNCDGKARELYTGTEVGFSTLCTSNEVTYKFVEDVIREIAAISPGPYFHIGGDESHVTAMKDYIPFINRVQAIAQKYNKQVIGWDEIAHAKLLPNSVVQYWAKAENAQMGIAQGAKVLMSPAKRAYLDMQYDSTTHLGLHWAAYIEVDEGYQWNLETIAEGIGQENITGIEAPLWSETVTTMDEIEYMAFPRIMGYAEIGWTPTADRNWDEYKVRLANQQDRLKALEVDFYPSKKVPWPKKAEQPVLKN